MNGKLKHFIELVKLHPELPVIPMVDTDVVASDEFSTWKGSFGHSEIKEFTWYEMYHDCEQMVLKEDNGGIVEYLMKCNDDMEEEAAQKVVDDLDWQKAIILDIGLPE